MLGMNIITLCIPPLRGYGRCEQIFTDHTGRQAGVSVATSELSQSLLFASSRAPTRALIHARATPHRPRLPGLTGPIAACEDGHPACYRHGINEPTSADVAPGLFQVLRRRWS